MKRRFASKEENTPSSTNFALKNVKLFTHCCSQNTLTDDILTFRKKGKYIRVHKTIF